MIDDRRLNETKKWTNKVLRPANHSIYNLSKISFRETAINLVWKKIDAQEPGWSGICEDLIWFTSETNRG